MSASARAAVMPAVARAAVMPAVARAAVLRASARAAVLRASARATCSARVIRCRRVVFDMVWACEGISPEQSKTCQPHDTQELFHNHLKLKAMCNHRGYAESPGLRSKNSERRHHRACPGVLRRAASKISIPTFVKQNQVKKRVMPPLTHPITT